jgi:hypothetical protein
MKKEKLFSVNCGKVLLVKQAKSKSCGKIKHMKNFSTRYCW